jgi:hypothetical protein
MTEHRFSPIESPVRLKDFIEVLDIISANCRKAFPEVDDVETMKQWITETVDLAKKHFHPYEQPAILLLCATILSIMAEDFFLEGDSPSGDDAWPGKSAGPKPSTH